MSAAFAMLERDPSLAFRDIWSAAGAGATDDIARMLDADPSLINARRECFGHSATATIMAPYEVRPSASSSRPWQKPFRVG